MVAPLRKQFQELSLQELHTGGKALQQLLLKIG